MPPNPNLKVLRIPHLGSLYLRILSKGIEKVNAGEIGIIFVGSNLFMKNFQGTAIQVAPRPNYITSLPTIRTQCEQKGKLEKYFVWEILCEAKENKLWSEPNIILCELHKAFPALEALYTKMSPERNILDLHNEKCYPQLTTLQLVYQPTLWGYPELPISSYPNLTHLDLEYGDFSQEFHYNNPLRSCPLINISDFKNFQKLTHLSLVFFPECKVQNICDLTNLSNLLELNLAPTVLPEEFWPQLRSFSQLKKLSLKTCSLDDRKVCNIADGLYSLTNLSSINLNINAISHQGIIDLIDVPHLNEIEVMYNLVNYDGAVKIIEHLGIDPGTI